MFLYSLLLFDDIIVIHHNVNKYFRLKPCSISVTLSCTLVLNCCLLLHGLSLSKYAPRLATTVKSTMTQFNGKYKMYVAAPNPFQVDGLTDTLSIMSRKHRL